ncbi:MAG: pilus assembly protein PilM [Desulfobacteraceae bacterium]|nr:pilus assembly protein PilM [Desulfobacteraceae bacterium]
MATEKDISSTEKLLKVIRSSSSDREKTPPAEGTRKPGFWEQIKHRLPSAKSRRIIGVEIFRDSVNIVFKTRDKYGRRLFRGSRTALPEGVDITHPNFPSFLKAQLRNADPSGKAEIWVCLAPSKGETWNVLVPKVKSGLTNAVYWSARKEKSFDESEYYFDYRITDEVNEKGIQKLAARVSIASAGEISLYKKIFSEAGYSLKGISLPGFVFENLFANRWIDPGDQACAALYIGEDSSYIEIRGRGTALFNRVIKTGRDSILDSLIMEYSQQVSAEDVSGIPPPRDRQEAAEILRRHAGLSDEKLFGMIQPALERLARQLERTIDHSVNVLQNPAPERIYICGGISPLAGLSDFFSQQMGLEAVIIDIPEQDLPAGSEDLLADRHQRLSLVSTTGLAMSSQNTVNFLHTALDRDRGKQALRNANLVAVMCALLFVATGIWWWSARHELEQARVETAALEKRLEQFTPQLTQEDLAEMAGKFREKNHELSRYSRNLYPVAALKEISRITPESIKLLAVRLENANRASGRSREKASVLTLEGFVRSEPSLYETRLTGYLLQLRRSPVFKNPSVVKSGEDTLDSGENVYRFTLNIKLLQV